MCFSFLWIFNECFSKLFVIMMVEPMYFLLLWVFFNISYYISQRQKYVVSDAADIALHGSSVLYISSLVFRSPPSRLTSVPRDGWSLGWSSCLPVWFLWLLRPSISIEASGRRHRRKRATEVSMKFRYKFSTSRYPFLWSISFVHLVFFRKQFGPLKFAFYISYSLIIFSLISIFLL